MSAPAEAPKSAEVAKPSTGHAPDAAVAKTADATHAAVSEAAKPAKPAKEVLTELQGAKDAAARKAVIEHLHLSPEEAKDAALQKSFKDAAHGDHDLEALIEKKFKAVSEAKDAGGHGEKKEEHGEKKPHAPEAHADAHGGDAHAPEAHAPAHADAHDDHSKGAAHAAKDSHADAHGGDAHAPEAHAPAHADAHAAGGHHEEWLITKAAKNLGSAAKSVVWDLPKSAILNPVVPTLQTVRETIKGGWAMFRGLFSKKYREDKFSNPPVILKPKPVPPSHAHAPAQAPGVHH